MGRPVANKTPSITRDPAQTAGIATVKKRLFTVQKRGGRKGGGGGREEVRADPARDYPALAVEARNSRATSGEKGADSDAENYGDEAASESKRAASGLLL